MSGGGLVSTVETDWLYLKASLPELPDYLLSVELFWPLTLPGVELPRLTVGGLLLARTRLRAVAMFPTEEAKLMPLEQQMMSIRSRWLAAWERKVMQEAHARLDLWKNYLTDYLHAPDQYADAYPQEVRWRAMLHLLLAELAARVPEHAALMKLDIQLRASLLPSAFIWEPEFVPGFPQDQYWFLYGRLKV